MKYWEYRVISVKPDITTEHYTEHGPTEVDGIEEQAIMASILDRWGAEGWELVNVSPAEISDGLVMAYLATFKRQRKGKQKLAAMMQSEAEQMARQLADDKELVATLEQELTRLQREHAQYAAEHPGLAADLVSLMEVVNRMLAAERKLVAQREARIAQLEQAWHQHLAKDSLV